MTAALLASLALGTLVSEDAACLAAGVLVARGQLEFGAASAACLLGIFVGDLLLFAAGRAARSVPWVGRWVASRWNDHRGQSVQQWFVRRGMWVVLLSRFTPGLRLPTYLAAGIFRWPAGRFAASLLVASLLWTPLLVGAAAIGGEAVVRDTARALAAAALFGCLAFLWKRRPSLAVLTRWTQWEFLPPWLTYVPVAFWYAVLAIRHRSLTAFTAANPGIFTGGLVGESKFAILRRLQGPGVAPTFFARAGTLVRPVNAPVVVKPDVGQRGMGVRIIRAERDAVVVEADAVVQSYVEGVEFGLYYCRRPGQAHGRILSITEKRFPTVVGDGRSTVAELIRRDRRARYLAALYLRQIERSPQEIPAAGEEVHLAELGSHCRGAIFLDGMRWWTPSLETRIDEISRRHPGFFLGRFDVRAASVEALQRGDLTVIELNGVGAEPTHIYDPAVPLAGAYRALFRHWSLAFEIGAVNRRSGHRPMALRRLLAVMWSHVRGDLYRLRPPVAACHPGADASLVPTRP